MIRIHILVHLKRDVLDVQGQAIRQAVTTARHAGVAGVEVGKSFYVDLDYPDVEAARGEIERLCEETLSNPLIETYSWEVMETA